MSTITVATADLRRALQAVAPHAAKQPEDTTMHRVRLTVGAENLTVTATNRYSAGLGVVSIEEHDGEIGDVDLSPENVRELLALFKSGKPGTDDEIGNTLRLDWDDQDFRITDTSGLFPGKALSVPRYPSDDNFPNLLTLALKVLTKDGEKSVEQLCTSGSLIALFKAAASAYGESLALEMTGHNSALVVSCGESFLIAAWRTAWLFRLQESELATA